MSGARTGKRPAGDERGIALLLALLVTALLIALVFEFAYSTRVSLREAMNFRDSQRAYFLARSGVKVFIKYEGLKESTPQGEWSIVPIVSGGDTELRMRWEDELGKIFIKRLLTTDADTLGWVEELFTIKVIDQAVLDSMTEHFKGKQMQLLDELRVVMTDEDFNKVARSLTLYSGSKMVNVNTASDDVLRSMDIDPALIVPLRPMNDRSAIPTLPGKTKKGNNVKDFLDVKSSVSTVYSYATVGEYTKQVVAVVNGATILYWRTL